MAQARCAKAERQWLDVVLAWLGQIYSRVDSQAPVCLCFQCYFSLRTNTNRGTAEPRPLEGATACMACQGGDVLGAMSPHPAPMRQAPTPHLSQPRVRAAHAACL